MKKTLKYIQPECYVELDYCPYELVCQSPEAGGLEDVGYDDWVIQG